MLTRSAAPAKIPVFVSPVNVYDGALTEPEPAVILVADAAPRVGVTSVGEVANTSEPLPVSSLITPSSSADVVAAKTLSLFAV